MKEKSLTLLIHVCVRYEFLILEFHGVDIGEHPSDDYLQSIRNTSVLRLNISFAKENNAFP